MADEPNKASEDFTAQSTQERTGLVTEFFDFLKDNKKWWLAPIIVSILGLGLLGSRRRSRRATTASSRRRSRRAATATATATAT